MLDHLALQSADAGAAADFHTRGVAPCGVRELMRYDSPGGDDVEAVHHTWRAP